jgi:hypothetical protein
VLRAAAARVEVEELIRAAFALALAAAPALAQGPQPTPRAPIAPSPIEMHARAIVALLAGKERYPGPFAPAFVAEVPAERFAAIAAQLRAELGDPIGVGAIGYAGPYAATVAFRFARGDATAQLLLDSAGRHRVTGFAVTGTQLRDDSAARLIAEFRALPGQAGFGIYRLDGDEPQPIAEWRGEAGAPIGSAFKLWLLAEASRQVQAGEHRWDEVVRVGAPSLPSGVLQAWPAASPVTLQTLAILMVSISDNTAADTMLSLLGRDRVDAAALATRSVEAARTLPVLSTREAFVLKADPALAGEWTRGDLSARRALLAREGPRIAAAPLSLGIYGAGRPLASESVEWFASPLGTARLLDWLHVHGDPTTLAILAVNGGTQAAMAERFAYLGFKGGSEPGVVSLNYLVRTASGHWLAVTGNWHRADGDTPEPRFAQLMNRALALAAAE